MIKSKCKHVKILYVLHVSGTDIPATQFMLGTDFIPTTNSVKYLGVHIDSNLKWINHISKITAKADRALGPFKRSLKEAPKKTKWTALNMPVKYGPHMLLVSQTHLKRFRIMQYVGFIG